MGQQIADLKKLLEELTGQRAPLSSQGPEMAIELLEHGVGALGYSQFNELLLLMGYDRVSHAFFQYLVDGSTADDPGSAITSMEQLREGVNRFRKLALLLFGNVKFAFKSLSRDTERLNSWLWLTGPRDEAELAARHDAILPLIPISGEDTYFLGYLVQREIAQRLQQNPDDQQALAAEQKRHSIVQAGQRNHEAYLVSDHLDVYVATSMRQRHEYLAVHELTREIFQHPRLAPLKLRWFDPTQSYCQDRIDKGLSEALMLKRAKCTVYFVQETDTLGKDSELAATLAQGKPVVAFVPQPGPDYVDKLLSSLTRLDPSQDQQSIQLELLRTFEPDAAWKDEEVRSWLAAPTDADPERVRQRLSRSLSSHYERRARTLREDHPLGIQVNLSTGVANGVLVVRTVDDCAELIWRIITWNLQFTIEAPLVEDREYTFLREVVSGCIYRVVTGDAMLMNAFWNFYLKP